VDHKVTPGVVTVAVKNGYGADILVNDVRAESCGSIQPAAILRNGAQISYAITCSSQISGSKYSGVLNISYTNQDSGLSRTNLGNIVGKVE
jgi:hypothetical protein